MLGKITKIDQRKMASDQRSIYIRVYFRMRYPDRKEYFWAKTDLVTTFGNYGRWRDLLKIGNILDNLKMKNKTTVDADSFPQFVKNQELGELDTNPQMKLL